MQRRRGIPWSEAGNVTPCEDIIKFLSEETVKLQSNYLGDWWWSEGSQVSGFSHAAKIRHRQETKKKKVKIIKWFLKTYISCISRLLQCFCGFKSVKAQHAKLISVITCSTLLCVCGVEHKNIGMSWHTLKILYETNSFTEALFFSKKKLKKINNVAQKLMQLF